ncbi:MAG: DUF4238 domain-containing protein [Lachnospiraceae bacterium]|nr:DUF4238 domain-containing protein [Lachnospiraceae bacterium]
MDNQKNDKRRQHYVPKFYLRNFSESKKSVGIYLFKEKKIIEHGSINDNLWKEYFYGEDAVVENKLADYEGKWDDIISAIIETEKLPDTNRDLVLIRYFILISSARTLKRGNQINNDYTSLTKKLLEVEEPELFERVTNAGEDGFFVKMNYPALPFIYAAQQCLPLVIDLKIDLLINRSAIDYVTSDNPTIFYNQLFREKNLSRGFGWGEYGIQFIIPISPRIAICMYDSEVYNMKEKILCSDSTINKLNELFLNNSDELIVFMYDGDDEAKNEKSGYINRLVKRRICPPVQDEDCNMISFSNKQVVGKHDLSDIFEINQKFKEMSISNHSKEEIEERLNAEIEKLVAKLQAMTEDERQALLESKKGELIGFNFRDMVRPWVKFYDKYQVEIMALYESGKNNT